MIIKKLAFIFYFCEEFSKLFANKIFTLPLYNKFLNPRQMVSFSLHQAFLGDATPNVNELVLQVVIFACDVLNGKAKMYEY